MASAAALALVAACSGQGQVEVDAPEVGGADAAACRALVEALPGRVDGARRRAVDPADAHTSAAWGDPPIVLRCGVGRAEGFDRFATCQEVNGVGWFVPEEQFTGEPVEVTMTTIGRRVNIEVVLPEEHWPPAAAMVDLAPAIRQAVPETDPCV